MISRRGFISAVAGGLLSAPFDTAAQQPPPQRTLRSFTRGQWTAYGTGTYGQAVWTGDGIPPNDAVPSKQTFGDYIGGTSGPGASFHDWCTAAFDIDRRRLVILLPGGHGSWSTNEVNEWDWATGTWNPDGRPMKPTVKLFKPNGVYWTDSATYLGRPGGPAALIDVNNDYPNNALIDKTYGKRLYPNARHTYGSVVYMPAVKKYWLWGGVAWWNPQSTYIVVEWDPATKKYELITSDQGFSYGGTPYACWDSVQNRVVFHDDKKLWAYYPTRAYGSRVRAISGIDGAAHSSDDPQMIFDPARNRAVLFGGLYGPAMYDFSGNPNSVTRQKLSITGTVTKAREGPGGLYDPVADRYVLWAGGKTIYTIDPGTLVSTAFTPSGGVTPGQPYSGEFFNGNNVGVWHRFFYVPEDDVYATINEADAIGAFVFAPIRSNSR